MSCNNAVFVELLDFLLSELAKNANISTTRTYIQCLGGITYVSTFNTNSFKLHMFAKFLMFVSKCLHLSVNKIVFNVLTLLLGLGERKSILSVKNLLQHSLLSRGQLPNSGLP